MDPLWITAAFAFGFAVQQAGLPPLVGFLMAGFALKALGVEAGPVLEIIAELGTTKTSERAGRAMDHEREDAFERLRATGYMEGEAVRR